MMQAKWRNMTWEVSNNRINPIQGLSTSVSLETETESDENGNSKEIDKGRSLQEISFNTYYSVETGTQNVREVLDVWKELIGEKAPLYIGGKRFGGFEVKLSAFSTNGLYIDDIGVMRYADVSLQFTECGENYRKYKEIYTEKDLKSALKVGMTKSQKKEKKKRKIKTK